MFSPTCHHLCKLSHECGRMGFVALCMLYLIRLMVERNVKLKLDRKLENIAAGKSVTILISAESPLAAP